MNYELLIAYFIELATAQRKLLGLYETTFLLRARASKESQNLMYLQGQTFVSMNWVGLLYQYLHWYPRPGCSGLHGEERIITFSRGRPNYRSSLISTQ